MNVQRSPFARKLGTFIDLSETELNELASLHDRRKTYTAGTGMVYQGQFDQQAYVLAEGWACSYRLLQGGGRQIVDFQIPGDFLGLRSVLFRSAGQCVEPVIKVQASLFDVSDLMEVFARNPRLDTAVLWAASRDDAMVIEHMVGIGRRNAVERTAHLLLELGARLTLVGLGTKAGYDCPLSQYLLADALGLSAVHVNRVLRDLREEKLVTFRNGRVDLTNFDGLVALANFDRDYLDHDRPLTNQAHVVDRYAG
jgi:CRP-like cAMP-binding protein